MQPVLILGAIAGVLGSLGGLGALVSAISGRRTTERAVVVDEYREIFDAQRKHADDLGRRLERAEVRIGQLEERVDKCEQEKAVLRADLKMYRELDQ